MADGGGANPPGASQGGGNTYGAQGTEGPQGQQGAGGKGSMAKVPDEVCGEARQHISNEDYEALQGGDGYTAADMQDMYERDEENGGWKLKAEPASKPGSHSGGDHVTSHPPAGSNAVH